MKPIEKLSRRHLIKSFDVFNIQGLTVFLLNPVISPLTEVLLGCPMVSTLNPGRRVLLSLSYLDLSECVSLDDTGLQMIGTSCPNLTHLYLRKCINITGKSTFFHYSRKMYRRKFMEKGPLKDLKFMIFIVIQWYPGKVEYMSSFDNSQIF